MKSNKPNIFLIEDTLSLLNRYMDEFGNIEADIPAAKEQRLLKGLFLYSYSLFESSLTKLYEIVLKGFPERMTLGDIQLKKYEQNLFSNSLSHTLISSIVDDYSKNLSYGKSVTGSLKQLCATLKIEMNRINTDPRIEEIKRRRNELAHKNLLDNAIDSSCIIECLKILANVLSGIRGELDVKYKSFTKTKLIRASWNYLFDSPLLNFDSHWTLDEEGVIRHYNSENLQRCCGSLSSSEKTFLIFFMINYSPSLCSSVFSIEDISMHASISNRDKIAFITELFDRYPLLLQGDRD